MRIGVDAHLVKRQPTGVGKAITRTIEALADAAAGDELVVYANRQFPDALSGKPNCRVRRAPMIARSRTLRILHERFLVPGQVRRDAIDVFFAPGYVFPGDVPAPMVLGIYDVNALKHPNLVRPETVTYYRLMLPPSAERAKLIIAPTNAVAGDIERILKVPKDRIRVVPCAADDRFRNPPRDRAAAPAKYRITGPYVLFVGNIEPNKNLVRLVEAFFAARVNRKFPHRLVIAGKKRYRAGDLMRRIQQLGCAEHVTFPGYVADDDLPGLYAGADAFVYPSHAEGFGIPPLEAMWSGTPTITSEDPAVVEVTGDGAIHCAANGLAPLRVALETVLTDKPLADRLVRRGREIAAQYSWAETGRKTLDVLREALNASA